MKNMIKWIKDVDGLVYTSYLQKVEQGYFAKLHAFCSWIGLPIPLFSMLIAIAGMGYLLIGSKALILEAGAYLFSQIINLIIKAIYRRNRPPTTTFSSPIPFDEFSFPSGHAAGTMAVAICMSAFIPGVWIVLFPWSFLMGIARFFGDYHHPSDIFVGFLVGIVTGYMSMILFSITKLT
jgi:membrane-associated phospholipid phosphatase